MKLDKEYLEKFGIEIEIATLHQSVHFPLLGSSDRTVSDSKSEFKGAKKYLLPQGLYIVAKNGREYIIPSAAMGVTMLPQAKEEKAKK